MTNFDRFIDRTIPHGPSSVEGLNGIEMARLIAADSRGRNLGGLDRGTLRDLGFDRSAR